MSPTRAAGRPPIRTVIPPGGRIGPPTCGTRTVTNGQTCMSVIRAAGIGIGSVPVEGGPRGLRGAGARRSGGRGDVGLTGVGCRGRRLGPGVFAPGDLHPELEEASRLLRRLLGL